MASGTFRKLINFRDCAHGSMRPNRILRSESLYKLPSADQTTLLEKYGLKVIVDLRTVQEAGDKPDVIPAGVTYRHIPLITMEEMGSANEKEAKRLILKERRLPDIYDYYRRFVLPERKKAWNEIFDCLLQQENGSILFHCTVGKDRTGIVSTMVFYALGLDERDIYDEYLKTNDNPVIPFAYKVFSWFLGRRLRKEFMEYFKAKKEYLDAALEHAKTLYGSIDGFLEEICGLTPEKRARLEELYLG